MRGLLLFLVALCAVPAVALSAELQHTDDSIDTVKKNVRSAKAVLLDVREEDEWSEGHLRDAELLPLSSLRDGVDADKLAEQLPKDKIIYTHCRSGRRSLVAGEIFKRLGYEVRPLKQGYQKLLEEGLPKAK